MLILIRTIFAWLLLLAIPVQGFAATAMLSCVPSHHHAIAQMDDALSNIITSGDHAAQAEHHHTEHAFANLAAQNEVASFDTPQKDGKVGAAKCNMFASCCIVSIIASPQSLATIAVTSLAPIAFVQTAFISHKPERLDPPPKSHFA